MDSYELKKLREEQRKHEENLEYKRHCYRSMEQEEQLRKERELAEDQQRFESDLEEERQRFNEELEEKRIAHDRELLQEQEAARKRAEREALSLCRDANGDKLLGIYEGALCDGLPNGEGKFYFDNGDIYVGCFLAGRFHGRGKLCRRDGDVRYDGEWQVGNFHGKGVYNYYKGDRKGRQSYEGDLFRGIRHGKGVLLWQDGTRYEGEFDNNIIQGFGVMTWPCGDRYEGHFVDSQRDGEGKYTSADGFSYEGSWKNGKRHGKGVLTFPDNQSFNVEWQDDKPYNGPCRTYHNGQLVYEGEYVNGVYEGVGSLHYYQNDELCYVAEGTFNSGRLRKGSYNDGVYLAKGDFDNKGLFYSGELYKNDKLLLSGDVVNGVFDVYLDDKVFHVRHLLDSTIFIGVDESNSAYLWVKINSLAHQKHGGNNFDNILIRECDIYGNFVSDGRPDEWLYAIDGSGYLKLDPRNGKGELHFSSDVSSSLMADYDVPISGDTHRILKGHFVNCEPNGSCVLVDASKEPTIKESVDYVNGKRHGIFKLEINDKSGKVIRTITGKYSKGVILPYGEVFYAKSHKKYQGEIDKLYNPNGVGRMCYKNGKTEYGVWSGDNCIEKLSFLSYLFRKMKL